MMDDVIGDTAEQNLMGPRDPPSAQYDGSIPASLHLMKELLFNSLLCRRHFYLNILFTDATILKQVFRL
jgi:hypothetical protein